MLANKQFDSEVKYARGLQRRRNPLKPQRCISPVNTTQFIFENETKPLSLPTLDKVIVVFTLALW